MLWRKTNIFADEDTTPLEYPRTEEPTDLLERDMFSPLTLTHKSDYVTPPPQKVTHENGAKTQTSTASFIEFYYLDENVDPMPFLPENNLNEKNKVKTEVPDRTPSRLSQFLTVVSRSPLFAFRLNEPAYQRLTSNPITEQTTTTNNIILQVKTETEKNMIVQNDLSQGLFERNMSPQYNTSPITTETTTSNTFTTFITETAPIATTKTPKELPNDRVSFFEIYDSNTYAAMKYTAKNYHTENKTMKTDQKVELEHIEIDNNRGPNKTVYHYAKKHVKNRDIAENYTQDLTSYTEAINKSVDNHTTTSEEPKETTRQEPKETTRTLTTVTVMDTSTAAWNDVFHYTAKTDITANWATYPFAAVYVYERYQIHCDAAAISAYWLISSAACLSRHRDNPTGERSAFVAYCGEEWWDPQRIAYVKYTLVHPRYHPHEAARRHLYNIGVIQVASSMSLSCPGWTPVSIMSHQYVPESDSQVGSAVGWGLNRYDTSYASSDLPRHPLAVFESYIHYGDCPGNSDYRNTKRVSEQATANVYCLALPAYPKEDTDPVHGGLLLVGGKLIALYLQEERRRWGDQSAQYTGVWRLIPWVLDVAKDPDDLDNFPLDR
ncbi:hypothetical protein NE865_13490 [Phthorimaea operculella]|nr:hypothetical protein NE865_13490 [Phthorimaea operculella]